MDLDSSWAASGRSPDLLARARAAGVPVDQLQLMLVGDAPSDRIELEIRWADLVSQGTIRWRQLTVADNSPFCDLWAHSPEEIGEWDVTAERGPNGFAQFQLQERPVLNALFDGNLMVACVGFSQRYTVVGGQRLPVRFGQAMRVHIDHRRHGYGNWVRSLPWAVGLSMPTDVQYDFIRAGNMTMERWNARHMRDVATVPKREGEVPGTRITVQQYPARETGDAPMGCRTATAADLDGCVDLINRTHAGRDLFRPYSVDLLHDRLDAFRPRWDEKDPAAAPYSLETYFVLERGGTIVACAGLWDRGRDLRERWRHRESGDERTIAVTSLLDFGFAEGREPDLAALVQHLIGRTHALGRDYLVAPFDAFPAVAAALAAFDPEPETRYMQWRTESPLLTPPVHLDLVYW